jgi:LacI family transcriptional regulator
MTLTIEDIATLARVSRSTVSRVLNEHPGVRSTVRDRVLRVIREQNYAPLAAARSLAGSRSDTIGFLMTRSPSESFVDPFISSIVQAVCRTSTQLGFVPMVVMLTTDMEPRFFNRVLRGRHFDGIIMQSSDVDDPILPLLIKDGGPLVVIGRHPYFQDITYVDLENRERAHEAVAHLVGLGHRRIALINGKLQMEAAQARRDGYKQALLEAGIRIAAELMVEGFYSESAAYHAMLHLLGIPDPPTAVFAASDIMASGALRAIRHRGLHVPEDIAVVGYNDLPLASYTTPSLTTVHQPAGTMGAEAVKLLTQHIKDQRRVESVRVAGRLVVRESSGANAASMTSKGGI